MRQQRLSLRQSQTLALTPGQKQSIELMLLPLVELQVLIERKLEENPFLERQEGPATGDGPAWNDEDWSEPAIAAPGPSLVQHLAQAIRLAFDDPAEQAIALTLLAELDEAGYLPTPLPPLPGRPPAARVEQVIARLQRLAAPGLFARSLAECLALQLEERGLLDAPNRRLLENLPLLAKGDLPRLAALTGLAEPALRQRLVLLRGLDPKPALAFSPPEAPPVIPDLLVTLNDKGQPQVRLNVAALPRLAVNAAPRRAFAAGLRRRGAKAAADRAYIAGRLAEAGWLVRALERRGQSLLALGRALAEHQSGFFSGGTLRPLTRKTLADTLNLSQSSVSRLVANKYLASPQGIIALGRLFTGGLGSEGASAAGASAALARLIAAEPPGTPLSDLALAERLTAAGYPVARRTVAKYRSLLKIPGTAERRRRARTGTGRAP